MTRTQKFQMALDAFLEACQEDSIMPDALAIAAVFNENDELVVLENNIISVPHEDIVIELGNHLAEVIQKIDHLLDVEPERMAEKTPIVITTGEEGADGADA
jgi:hypothetical protein